MESIQKWLSWKELERKTGYFLTEASDVGKTQNLTPAAETRTNFDIMWSDGRRIVELEHLASQLAECQKCRTAALHLKDCINETRYGFGSVLTIKCEQCSHMNHVHTGKQNRDQTKKDTG